jgi:hypothetical protein
LGFFLSPLDKVIDATKLLTLNLATKETEMMMQFAVAGLVRDARAIPVACDASPALFFGLDIKQSCGGEADAR